MPELPEVETVVRDLSAAGLPGSRIRSVAVGWARTVGGDPSSFAARVAGRTFVDLRRRGKWIVASLDRETLLMHLRMSGRLYLASSDEPVTGYERVSFELDGERRLDFYDPRKFGRVVATDSPESILAALGPEPLDDTTSVEVLSRRLAGTRRAIKVALLDQRVLAGLGNIYVDEALWAARVHPLRRCDTLTDAELVELHASIRAVLARGVANLGTRLGTGKSNFTLPGAVTGARNQEELKVFRRTGQPCPVCGRPIERIIVGQRASHVCANCQRPPLVEVATG